MLELSADVCHAGDQADALPALELVVGAVAVDLQPALEVGEDAHRPCLAAGFAVVEEGEPGQHGMVGPQVPAVRRTRLLPVQDGERGLVRLDVSGSEGRSDEQPEEPAPSGGGAWRSSRIW
jgi:hypothetical protein